MNELLKKILGIKTTKAPKATKVAGATYHSDGYASADENFKTNITPGTKKATPSHEKVLLADSRDIQPDVEYVSPYHPGYKTKSSDYINKWTRQLTPDVIPYIKKYTPPTKDWMDNRVNSLATLAKLSPEELKAILWEESKLGANPKQFSGPAIGPFQIEWDTHSDLIKKKTGAQTPEEVRANLYNKDISYQIIEELVKQRMQEPRGLKGLWKARDTKKYQKHLSDGKFIIK